MSRAQVVRSIIGLGGGGLTLTVWLMIPHTGLALLTSILVSLLTSIAAERAFRHYAAPNEIRIDLVERVRNPPS